MRVVGLILLFLVVAAMAVVISWFAYEHVQEYSLFQNIKHKKVLGIVAALTWPLFVSFETIFEIIKK